MNAVNGAMRMHHNQTRVTVPAPGAVLQYRECTFNRAMRMIYDQTPDRGTWLKSLAAK